MLNSLIFLSAFALGTTGAAVAADPAPAQTTAKAAKPKLLCRPIRARTGSHRPQGKVCKTADEWRIRDRDVLVQGPLEDNTRVEVKNPPI
jgi:hypothetical protein